MPTMKLFQLLFAGTALLTTSLIAGQSHSMMKATVVHEYGGPEVLKFEDAPKPKPKDDEMLIRVIAAGVNPVDGEIRSGKYAQFFKSKLSLIPGYDIAGIVDKTGVIQIRWDFVLKT